MQRCRGLTCSFQSSRSNNMSARPSIAPSFVSGVPSVPRIPSGDVDDARITLWLIKSQSLPSRTRTVTPTPTRSGHGRAPIHPRSLSDGNALAHIRTRLESTDPNVLLMLTEWTQASHMIQPHQIALPKPKSNAPTAYDDAQSPITSPRSGGTRTPGTQQI